MALQVRVWAGINDQQTSPPCYRSAGVFSGHEDAVRVVAAKDRMIFSGAYDGSVGIW